MPAVAREIAAAAPAKTSVADLERKGINSILSNDFAFAAEAFAEAYKTSPTFHNVDEINRLLQSQKEEFTKAQFAKDEGKIKAIWEKIHCEISENYLWGIDVQLKKQFQEKIDKEAYKCAQATNSSANSTTNTNRRAT